MLFKLKVFWRITRQNLRQLSGEDAYERYLERLAEHHKIHAAKNGCNLQHDEPLNRAQFFKQWQDEKWTGIKRCC